LILSIDAEKYSKPVETLHLSILVVAACAHFRNQPSAELYLASLKSGSVQTWN